MLGIAGVGKYSLRHRLNQTLTLERIFGDDDDIVPVQGV